MITDGQNTQFRDRLAAAVWRCEGYFRCDCRVVGAGWDTGELRKISAALPGSVDVVPGPAGMAAGFEAMMQASVAGEAPGLALRVWTPPDTMVRFVRQVAPVAEDLTGRRVQTAPPAGDYPTGAWGTESRDYHLCVETEPAGAG